MFNKDDIQNTLMVTGLDNHSHSNTNFLTTVQEFGGRTLNKLSRSKSSSTLVRKKADDL